MSAPTLITGLYPPPVRERWGSEISRDIAERGARSWPDAVSGAVRLWLHPSDWPETAAGQTRRVLAVVLFVITAGATLLLRAGQPTVHPLTTALWLAPITLGALLAVPLPSPRWRAVATLVAETARTMAVPVVAVGLLFALANSGLVDHPTGVTRVVLVAYYWSTLAFVAVRACMLVARVLQTGIVPTTRRLRGALLFVGLGTALAAGQSALAMVQTDRAGAGPLAVTAALGLLAGLSLQAGQDLHRTAG